MVKGSSPPEALLWVLQAVTESKSLLRSLCKTHPVNEMEAKRLAQAAALAARAFATVKRFRVREKSVGAAQEVPAQEVPLTPKKRQGAAKEGSCKKKVPKVKAARGTAETCLRTPTSKQP